MQPLSANGLGTVKLLVSASNKFSTVILPFDAEIPAGLRLFCCDEVDDDHLVLVEQEQFKAYTPISYTTSADDA